MTEEAALILIEARLQALTWADSPNQVVFGSSAIITAAPSIDALARRRLPAALIRPGSLTADIHQPNFFEADLDITLIVSTAGDDMGRNAIMGANRVTGTSQGAGIIHVGEAVLESISMLNANEGFVIKHTFSSGIGIEQLNETSWINMRTLKFQMYVNSAGSKLI